MRRLRHLILALTILGLALVPTALALKIDTTPPPNGFVGKAYTFQFKPESGQGCNPLTFKYLTGALPPGLSISSGGTMSGTPTTKGSYTFYVELQSCQGNTTQRQFTMQILEKLTITGPEPLPDAAINQAYAPVQLTASGGSVSSWTVDAGLPAGMTLSSGGQLSGTPTVAGDFAFNVVANGSSLSDNHIFHLHVTAPLALNGPGGIAVKSEPVPLNGKIGTEFSWGVQAQGGKLPYTYTSTPLPAGIALDSATGNVLGTPTVAFSGTVTFTVTDGNGATDTLQAKLTIKALLAFSTTAKPPAGKVGKAFRWRLPVTGASKTKLFVASGAFPPGLSLDELTGILSGSPLQAGNFRVKFWVLGDPGTQIYKSYTIKVSA